MFFKRIFFIIFYIFALPNCGLYIGETFNQEDLVLDLNTMQTAEQCNNDDMDYKDLWSEIIESNNYLKAEKKINKFFSCIESTISTFQDQVRGEQVDSFSTKEIDNFLRQHVFIDEELPFKVSNGIRFKNASINFMQAFQIERGYVKIDLCYIQDQDVLHKKELNVIKKFLKDLSYRFKLVYFYADNIHTSMNQMEKSNLNVRDLLIDRTILEFKDKDILPKLSKHVLKFLESTKEDSYSEKSEETWSLFLDSIGKNRNVDFLTKKDVRYFLLNVVFVGLLLEIYDTNVDGILSENEVENLGCLIRPLIDLFFEYEEDHSKMVIRRKFEGWLSGAPNIFEYMIRYETFPKHGTKKETMVYATKSLMNEIRSPFTSKNISGLGLMKLSFLISKKLFFYSE